MKGIVHAGAVLMNGEYRFDGRPSYLVAHRTPTVKDGCTPCWEWYEPEGHEDVRKLRCWATADAACAFMGKEVVANEIGIGVVVMVSHAPIGPDDDPRGIPTATIVDVGVHPLFTDDMTDGGAPSLHGLARDLGEWYVTHWKPGAAPVPVGPDSVVDMADRFESNLAAGRLADDGNPHNAEA